MTATTTGTAPDRVDEWTKPAFLRRVRIQGYKSIAFCDVALQPLTVLVGRNGAGKSNFLDALAFLRDAMETNLTEAVKRRGGPKSIICRSANVSKIRFELEAGFTCGRPYGRNFGNSAQGWCPPSSKPYADLTNASFSARYRIELTPEGSSSTLSCRESLEIADGFDRPVASFEVADGVLTSWKSGSDAALSPNLPQSRELLSISRPNHLLLSMIGSQPFIELGDGGLQTMRFYNLNPEVMRVPQPQSRGPRLERDGSNIARAILGLMEIDPPSVDRVVDYLKLVSPEIQTVETDTVSGYDTLRFHIQGRSGESVLQFEVREMSDGTLRALSALVAAFQIYLPAGPAVVGIEEPEAALHPAAAQALMDAFDEATRDKQILLTTHSADLLASRNLTPGQVLVVRKRAGRSCITPVDPASREIIRKELYSLADLQRMDQLDLDEADVERQATLFNGTEGT
jgi:predicted ATPase